MSPTSADEAFAANLKALRARTSTTQADLAEKMSNRGFKWHPATVYKVENGERQIQLAEALEISRIFDTAVELMVRDAQAQQVIEARDSHHNLRTDYHHLVVNIQMFHETAVTFARILAADDEARRLLPADELRQMVETALEFESIGRKLLDVVGKPRRESAAMWHTRLDRIEIDFDKASSLLRSEVGYEPNP